MTQKSQGDILTLNDLLYYKTSGVFLMVFWITLFLDRRPPGFLPFVVEIMPDKVILDRKNSYLVYF